MSVVLQDERIDLAYRAYREHPGLGTWKLYQGVARAALSAGIVKCEWRIVNLESTAPEGANGETDE